MVVVANGDEKLTGLVMTGGSGKTIETTIGGAGGTGGGGAPPPNPAPKGRANGVGIEVLGTSLVVVAVEVACGELVESVMLFGKTISCGGAGGFSGAPNSSAGSSLFNGRLSTVSLTETDSITAARF